MHRKKSFNLIYNLKCGINIVSYVISGTRITILGFIQCPKLFDRTVVDIPPKIKCIEH